MASLCILIQGGRWGRETEERIHRHRDRRENSLVFHFMETLNLLDDSYTLRAHLTLKGFSGGSDSNESAHNGRDLGSIPRSGKFPGEGNGKPLLCLPEKSHGQRSLLGYRQWCAKKSEPFSKHSTLAVWALTHVFEEHTFSP